jgi:hypothetical protein
MALLATGNESEHRGDHYWHRPLRRYVGKFGLYKKRERPYKRLARVGLYVWGLDSREEIDLAQPDGVSDGVTGDGSV